MDSSSSFVLVVLILQAVVIGCSSLDELPVQLSNRRLLHDRNHAALLYKDHFPTVGNMTFPTSHQLQNDPNYKPLDSSSHPAEASAKKGSSKGFKKWLYIVVIPVAGLIMLAGMAWMFLPCRKKSVATIGPWRTGLSGQLQKAFVSGNTAIFAILICNIFLYCSVTSYSYNGKFLTVFKSGFQIKYSCCVSGFHCVLIWMCFRSAPITASRTGACLWGLQ